MTFISALVAFVRNSQLLVLNGTFCSRAGVKLKYGKRRQAGQATVEFVIVGGLFLAMLFGCVEMTYIYRAKHTLNTATFNAVRAGTIHNAMIDPMNQALAEGMAPLFMQGGGTERAYQDAVQSAVDFVGQMTLFGNGVTVISPSLNTFNALAVTQPVQLTNQSAVALQSVLPNDNLEWRNRNTQSTFANGHAAKINLQDANLLKIESYWCQRLIVPGLDVVLHAILPASPEQSVCDQLTARTDEYYIVIESSAVARMQSPITSNGNLH